MTQVPLYDALAADYDRFVNWEGRLARELPFLDTLLRKQRVSRVLDVACGTGHHVMALSRLGYQVVGTDLSAAMIEQARENASQAGLPVTFSVAGFGSLSTLGVSFDALLCLGNSLPHLLTADAVRGALQDFGTVLNPGGVLVLQFRNFDRVWATQERFMSPQSHRDEDRELIFLRFYDFHVDTVTFNLVRLRRAEEGWSQDVNTTTLRPIFRQDLLSAFVETGFGDTSLYGGVDGSAFEPTRSDDLIAVAHKA